MKQTTEQTKTEQKWLKTKHKRMTKMKLTTEQNETEKK
jgi:hypothetical protein